MSDRDTHAVDPIIAEARERWNRCDEAEDAQRKSILTAKQFRAGDQWPDAIKIQRQGSSAIQGQAAQPPRPCLTVDRLSPAVRQVSNQIKAANFAIDVLPNGFGADDETAELFKGYLRRVQMQARGESPIEWAADGAIEAGLGWFRLRTDYVHDHWDGPPDDPAIYDQEVTLERIANSLTVYCDPSATKPTRSDAQFMFVTEDLSKDEFKRRWPKADVRSLEDFMATGDMQGWADKDNIRIAEYWRIVYDEQQFTQYQDGSIREGAPDKDTPYLQTRVMRVPKVEGFKINALEVLEQWDWVGSRIPLIPILGEELNVDGKIILRGITQEGMDAQRMVNYTYSGAMEIFALGNKSPYVVEEQQIADYQGIWQTANTYNYSFLPYKYVPNVPPPIRQVSEAPIQAAVELMVKSEDAIKATTSIYDPSLGNTNPREHSGRAIQALQSQSELGASNYSNNVGRALVYAGQLMLEIIPKITRPGQLLHIIGQDDEPQQVIVGQAFQQGPNGQPMPSPGVTPEMAKRSKGLHQFYDLNQGRYSVTVTVGKATATKREEGALALGQLIPHLPPEMAAVATPDYVEQLSFPGAHKIAEKLRKALPPALQDQDENGPDPRLQAMAQQIQQLQGALQSKVAEKQAEAQAKGQIELAKTQIQESAETQRAREDNETKLAVAELGAKVDRLTLFLEERARLGVQGADQISQAVEQRHELVQQASDQAHERQMAQMEHQHALEQGAQANQAAMQQNAQQAALQPQSETGNGAT